jgi:hypothetical protein
MPRIEGVVRGGSLLARIAFQACRRKVGRVVRPVRVHALSTALLAGYGAMETAQEKARRVPELVRMLANLRVATRIGCPF